jgi:lipoprotein-anchoring transpeptidase ErfK/SrfK
MKRHEYTSPDGLLTLVVTHDANDVTTGFAGFPWHTHEEILESVLANRAIIAVLKRGDAVEDIWITDDVENELRYKQPDEEIVFRYWNGSHVLDGSGRT